MSEKYIIVYRQHGQLNCETQFIGPFDDFEAAYEHFCTMPALGVCEGGLDSGVKYIKELTKPCH